MPTTRVYTVEGAQRAIATLPRELQKELRVASKDIASGIASEASDRARSQGGVAGLIARYIKARPDRYPVIEMGSRARLPTSGNGWSRTRRGSRQRIVDLMYGAEFGGGSPRTPQFANHPHRGTRGYFLYPTVRDRERETLDRWLDALQSALERI